MDHKLKLHPSQPDQLDGKKVEVAFKLKRWKKTKILGIPLTKSLSYLGMFKNGEVCSEASETCSPVSLFYT